MKRTIIILAAIIASVTASAQINFGARVGTGLNSVPKREIPNIDYTIENNSIVGPTAGVIASLSACEWLDVQAELNYTMRGYSDNIYIMDEKGGEHKSDYSVRTSYLELPLLAKFYPIKQIGLNIQAGPQIGYLLGRSVTDLGKDFAQEQYDQLVGENRKFDCALVFGLGLDIKKWCVDLRYTHGLVETNKDWNGCKNRGFSLALGYYFK